MPKKSQCIVRILFVGEDQDCFQPIIDLLEKIGHQIMRCQGQQEAIEALHNDPLIGVVLIYDQNATQRYYNLFHTFRFEMPDLQVLFVQPGPLDQYLQDSVSEKIIEVQTELNTENIARWIHSKSQLMLFDPQLIRFMNEKAVACFQHWDSVGKVHTEPALMKYTPNSLPQVTSLLEFHGKKIAGRVYISAKRTVFIKWSQLMMGLDEAGVTLRVIWDTAGEMANLLGTECMNYLNERGLVSRIGTPIVTDGSDQRIMHLGKDPAMVIPIKMPRYGMEAFVQLQLTVWDQAYLDGLKNYHTEE